jgi:4'-phosphopantetheinyl transferase
MIYFFDNYDGVSAEDLAELLPSQRREKFQKLKKKRDRENCAISYLLLKKALRNYGIDSFHIAVGENGKPYLSGCDEVFFNISHSDSGVAVIVDKAPVGIDIQDIVPVRDGIIERCFSQEEKGKIYSSPVPERAFTRLWTLKESAVKCNGETIADLHNYCFTEDENIFKKYEKTFTVFERKNLFISACGQRDFSDIIYVKNKEELL